jgi:pilus assembly protein FimV
MAYGRDAQAEEILKEALGKDANRVAAHVKLLEIYANRRDAKTFEQTALKVKSLSGGAGVEWDKATALGRSIDPENPLYGGAGAAAPEVTQGLAQPVAAPAPALDFDLGGSTGETPTAPAASVDFDLGAAPAAPVAPAEKTDFAPGGTLIIDSKEAQAASAPALDFDLGMGGEPQKKADSTGALDFDLGGGTTPAAPAAAALATVPADTSGAIDFDLNLDLGGAKVPAAPAAPAAVDLSGISLDLGAAPEAAQKASTDPKWQEVATKLDLAKAYEEMGDKDGARELLNEVLKEGDAAQQGQAKQMLAALG